MDKQNKQLKYSAIYFFQQTLFSPEILQCHNAVPLLNELEHIQTNLPAHAITDRLLCRGVLFA